MSTGHQQFEQFEPLWQAMTTALREPALLSVEGTPSERPERFHAWYDRGGDGKPEAIWTKPFQGEKQVRLPHRYEDFAKVHQAVRQGTRDPEALRQVALRGHYLYTLMRRFGLE